MFKVNLINRKRRSGKKKDLFSYSGLAVFFVLTIYFLVQVVMLVIKLVSINRKLVAVRAETGTLSAQILKDNTKLNEFILTKYILGEIKTLRSKQFNYSDYLDRVQRIIPLGTEIIGVDFQTTGFINIKTTSVNSSEFKLLENSLRNVNLSATGFNSVVVRSVSTDVDGRYRADLLFGIQRDGKI